MISGDLVSELEAAVSDYMGLIAAAQVVHHEAKVLQLIVGAY